MCLLPTMNSIKSAKTKSTIPAKHQLNNGEILHPARRFESLPVLAVVSFNTGKFLTPPRQEKFISCIWYLVGTAAEDRSKQKLISHNDSSDTMLQSFRSPSVLKQHNKTSLASSMLGNFSNHEEDDRDGFSFILFRLRMHRRRKCNHWHKRNWTLKSYVRLGVYQLKALEEWEKIATSAFGNFEQEGHRIISVQELAGEMTLAPNAYPLLKDWIWSLDGKLSSWATLSSCMV
ncbi:LOW QUALITY PROTEIN: hypothetical protein HID58_077352 [Brassica napus]|uniref:Uncharacterized protein n=1 Tax=Brassica napus TaxID=3708 RepID=A0ABQ7YT65_BRANA|nr:LOW QUALITY PROTEIN: hypothetical protein HID58_077352 [Brassica napus]